MCPTTWKVLAVPCLVGCAPETRAALAAASVKKQIRRRFEEVDDDEELIVAAGRRGRSQDAINNDWILSGLPTQNKICEFTAFPSAALG